MDNENYVEKIRHSCAHVLAQAVKELYPKVKLGIGPAIEKGFYYDFDNLDIKEDDLKKIEEKMDEIVKKNHKFELLHKSKKEAEKILKDEPYKLELLKELKDGEITFYQDGNFLDLCKGPHVNSTNELKAFKLMKIAGAYWKGDSKSKMLTRIYGVAFDNKDELNKYIHQLQEAEKRNHIKLGKHLELFSFQEEGPGFPFWHPKGTIIYNDVVDFLRKEYDKRGYKEIKTPLVLNNSIWKRSGHWDHYRENMYFVDIDNGEYAIKPMNCPGSILIFKSEIHSYKEFPLRLAEFGTDHRHELSGVLNGLFRVRAFTQDDAHIYCTPEQIKDEIVDVIDFVFFVYKTFGFNDFHVELSTRPEKSIGSDEIWNKAEGALKSALKEKDVNYKLNPGEGAFYGPKIDFHIKDSLGRTWQCGTIQVDFAMPERFELTYESADGKKSRPVMIHRAIFGSIERFIGILIEHYAGKFPLWLSPVQIKILTITDRNIRYANEVLKKLKFENFRVELDDRNESIPKKVRDAQLMNIPVIITVGDKEVENKSLAIRTLDGKIKFGVKIGEFIKSVKDDIEKKNVKFII